MSDYRQKLIRMVEETGIYIYKNAEKIINDLDCKTEVTIWIRFNQNEVPTIEIQQEHAIVSCLKDWRVADE